MQKFRELEKETADLKAELVTLTGNDPAVIEAMGMLLSDLLQPILLTLRVF
jgi:hypothetical protein